MVRNSGFVGAGLLVRDEEEDGVEKSPMIKRNIFKNFSQFNISHDPAKNTHEKYYLKSTTGVAASKKLAAMYESSRGGAKPPKRYSSLCTTLVTPRDPHNGLSRVDRYYM